MQRIQQQQHLARLWHVTDRVSPTGECSALSGDVREQSFKGDSANAVPHYQKLCCRVSHIWGNRRGQPNRSAMEEPRSGGTAFLITVNPSAR